MTRKHALNIQDLLVAAAGYGMTNLDLVESAILYGAELVVDINDNFATNLTGTVRLEQLHSTVKDIRAEVRDALGRVNL